MAQSGRLDLKQQFQWIMDTVVKNVQPDFAQEGVEEIALTNLRQLWEQKLQERGLMEEFVFQAETGGQEEVQADKLKTTKKLPQKKLKQELEHQNNVDEASNAGLSNSRQANANITEPQAAYKKANQQQQAIPQLHQPMAMQKQTQQVYVQPGLQPTLQYQQSQQQLVPQQQGSQIVQATANINYTMQPQNLLQNPYAPAFQFNQYTMPMQQPQLAGQKRPAEIAVDEDSNKQLEAETKQLDSQLAALRRVKQQSVQQNPMQTQYQLPAVPQGPMSYQPLPFYNPLPMGQAYAPGLPQYPLQAQPQQQQQAGLHSQQLQQQQQPRPPNYMPQTDGCGDDAECSLKGKAGTRAASKGAIAQVDGNDELGEFDSDEDSDTEDSDDLELQNNMLVAFYDEILKINRKTKWKATMRGGIMHVDGREIMFNKGIGEFNFDQ